MAELVAVMPMLAVTDIPRAVSFYERIGFTQAYQDEQYGILTRDKIEIHVWKWEGFDVLFDPNVHANGCYIRVRGIEDLYTRLEAQGIVPSTGQLQEMPWGRQFTALDPDNNALHFAEQVG